MADTRDTAATELEVAARLDERPGNPAITPEGRIILSLHPFPHGEASPYRVVEVLDDGSTRSSPNEEWSAAPGAMRVWTGGMSYGPDGHLYVTASQLHRSAPLNAGEEAPEPPFEALRFRPLAPSAVGH